MKCEICGESTMNKYCNSCSMSKKSIKELNSLCKSLEELIEKAEEMSPYLIFFKRSEAVQAMEFARAIFFEHSVKTAQELQEEELKNEMR